MDKSRVTLERLREARERCGLLQAELARAVGLTRQSIQAIESGRAMPKVDVALRIAAIVGHSVEDLFDLTAQDPRLSAESSEGGAAPGDRVALAQLDGRWVSYPLKRALCGQAADGIVRRVHRNDLEIERLASDRPSIENVVLMGCAPALGVLAARLNQRAGSGRFLWIPVSSTAALAALSRQHTHVAGVHLVDPATGQENLPDVRRHSGHGLRSVITLARWEIGLVVEKGNPRQLRSVTELVSEPRRGVRSSRRLRLVAREPGSGVRRRLEAELVRAGVSDEKRLATAGVASGHLEVAQAIAMGTADAGLATRDAALAYDLDFIPVYEERYDLALAKDSLDDPRLQRLFDTLTAAAFRRDLSALGYDAQQAGTRVGEVRAA